MICLAKSEAGFKFASLLKLMKKLFAFFLIIVYAGFIGGTIWSVPLLSKYEFRQALGGNTNEVNDSEPSKEVEAPYFTRISKNLPGKIKLSRSQAPFFSARFLPQKNLIHPGKPALAFREFGTHNTPLFIKNRVFRI